MLIKICGIKEQNTLFCCEKNNVDFFGMIFFDKSPRNINVDQAKILQNSSRDLNIQGVGVFVDHNLNEITNIIKELELKYVQLHGREDNYYIKSLKNLNVKIIKKISIKESSDLIGIKDYPNSDYFLFDYKPKNNELPGGNAKSFDWDIVKDLSIKKPWFLSGGINFDNISLLNTKINPCGIDLSSGVEKELGIKDNDIINNLIDKIKNA